MKRRKFLIDTAGAIAGLAIAGESMAAPCPPPSLNSVTSGNCPVPAGSGSLSDAAASLGQGQSVFQPISPNPFNDLWDISWQSRTAFYDEVHSEIQYMGKGQNGRDARHFIYSVETDSWRLPENNLTPGDLGHIWICSFDHTDNPGDYFYGEHQTSGAYFWRFDRSRENGQGNRNSPWSRSRTASFDVWAGNNTPHPGILYHPNLLGPGNPGVFCLSAQAQMSIWDQSNDTWINLGRAGSGSSYGLRANTATLYVPGLGVGVFGNGKEKSEQTAILIEGSYNDEIAPPRVPIPFRIAGGNGNNSAMMLLDPRDSTRRTVMLLERGGSSEGGRGRVWTCADITAVTTTSDWTLESFTHPFWSNTYFSTGSIRAGRWTACSLPNFGCVLGLTSIRNDTQGSFESVLWRPG